MLDIFLNLRTFYLKKISIWIFILKQLIQKMITVISGTNRRGSVTEKFAKHFYKLLKSKTKEEVKYFSLQKLPEDVVHNSMYSDKKQSKSLRKIQKEIMIPAEKYFVISPEYNGSFPGILKLFIDACSIYEYRSTFNNKKVALVGVASGRAGNLRGLDHLTGVFHHVGSNVMPNKLPISKTGDLMDNKGNIADKNTLKTMEALVNEFLKY